MSRMVLALRRGLVVAASVVALLGCGRTHSDSTPASALQSPPAIDAEPTERASAASSISSAAHEDAAPRSSADQANADRAGADHARASSAASGAPLSSAKPSPNASIRCPPAPLKNGAACKARGECTYVDCAGAGRVTVRCNGTKASVEALPCSAYRCGGVGGIDCTGDNLCVERSSGFHDVQCAANPCGKAPLSCDCAAGLCNGAPCSVSGTFVHCGGGCKGCPQ